MMPDAEELKRDIQKLNLDAERRKQKLSAHDEILHQLQSELTSQVQAFTSSVQIEKDKIELIWRKNFGHKSMKQVKQETQAEEEKVAFE